jgi:hypothetical protein
MNLVEQLHMELIKNTEADTRGRVTLGLAVATPGRQYRVYVNPGGLVLLVPDVPASEARLRGAKLLNQARHAATQGAADHYQEAAMLELLLGVLPRLDRLIGLLEERT